jgi:hypothetical protein
MPGKNGIDRLELLVNADLEIAAVKAKLKAVQSELAKNKNELKKLQAIGPERLKKKLAENKKKLVSSNLVIKNQTAELVKGKRVLKKAEEEIVLYQSEQNQFYTSICGNWCLYFTGFKYPNEKTDTKYARIRCLNRTSGTSVIISAVEGNEITCGDDADIPVDVIAEILERVDVLGLYK